MIKALESLLISRVCFYFSKVFIIFLTLNMFVIIVVLLNFLIGQISYRYGRALDEATLNYDIDKTLLIARTEKLMKSKLSPLHYMFKVIAVSSFNGVR